MKIINTACVAHTPYLNLMTSSYEDDKGNVKAWEWVERVGQQNAVVIAALHKGLLVVIKEFRVPLQDYEWGLPAGLIDHGEDPEVTVRRELHEETGLTVNKFLRPISPLIYNTAGMTNEGVHMAFVEASGAPSRDLLGESEDITTHLMSQDEVKALMQQNVKFGAKAYLVFERFATHGDI